MCSSQSISHSRKLFFLKTFNYHSKRVSCVSPKIAPQTLFSAPKNLHLIDVLLDFLWFSFFAKAMIPSFPPNPPHFFIWNLHLSSTPGEGEKANRESLLKPICVSYICLNCCYAPRRVFSGIRHGCDKSMCLVEKWRGFDYIYFVHKDISGSLTVPIFSFPHTILMYQLKYSYFYAYNAQW